jgi:hypothetical protein
MNRQNLQVHSKSGWLSVLLIWSHTQHGAKWFCFAISILLFVFWYLASIHDSYRLNSHAIEFDRKSLPSTSIIIDKVTIFLF